MPAERRLRRRALDLPAPRRSGAAVGESEDESATHPDILQCAFAVVVVFFVDDSGMCRSTLCARPLASGRDQKSTVTPPVCTDENMKPGGRRKATCSRALAESSC